MSFYFFGPQRLRCVGELRVLNKFGRQCRFARCRIHKHVHGNFVLECGRQHEIDEGSSLGGVISSGENPSKFNLSEARVEKHSSRWSVDRRVSVNDFSDWARCIRHNEGAITATRDEVTVIRSLPTTGDRNVVTSQLRPEFFPIRCTSDCCEQERHPWR